VAPSCALPNALQPYLVTITYIEADGGGKEVSRGVLSPPPGYRLVRRTVALGGQSHTHIAGRRALETAAITYDLRRDQIYCEDSQCGRAECFNLLPGLIVNGTKRSSPSLGLDHVERDYQSLHSESGY
jgi:hypothetical protein